MEKNVILYIVVGLLAGLLIGAIGYILSIPAKIETIVITKTIESPKTTEYVKTTPLTTSIKETETKEEWGWKHVITFTGKTSRTTEVFHISSDKWRIRWSYIGGELASFGYFIYPEGETVSFIDALSELGESKSDITYIYKKGNFYLKIYANVEKWEIIVEEWGIITEETKEETIATQEATKTVTITQAVSETLKAEEWEEVVSFSGSNNTTTETFYVEREWRIYWTVQFIGHVKIRFDLYNEKESRFPTISFFVEGSGSINYGIVYPYGREKGNYYIKVYVEKVSNEKSFGIGNWKLTIQRKVSE
jgi:hypothetical protein